ncbi:MAG TPA: hypothetical protein VFC51_03520 [Chloroflexota bacterium]|nr:hypothetical protein [Chloroflexota bacterium]
MLMQEAFRRALDQLEADPEEGRLDAGTLRLLHSAVRRSGPESATTTAEAHVEKLVYSARKIARRWCSFAHAGQDSCRLLNALRNEWVVLVRQLETLPEHQRVLVLWEIVGAMEPQDVRHDGDRCRYLVRQAAAHPDRFAGLIDSRYIPWPGPASFLVHAIEELEDATAMERLALHRRIDEQWRDEPLWLISLLACWLQERYATVDG